MASVRNVTRVLLMTLVVGAAVGCGTPDEDGVSEQERRDRQDLTFDVSGRYLEDAEAGVPSRLVIANEAGWHDIVAILELKSGLKEADRVRLQEAIRKDDPALVDADVQAVVGRVEAALLNVKLGEGETFPQRGGENVVLDRVGDVAEVSLRRSISDVARLKSSKYDVTLDLYMTVGKASSRIGFETTPFTDDLGRGESGVKGLLLTLTRSPLTGTSAATTTVTSEMSLSLASLVKY